MCPLRPEKSIDDVDAFFNEAHLRCMKNEAGLRPMKRAFGTQKRTGALRFMRAKRVLHGGNAAASLTSEASDFIFPPTVSSRKPKAFLRQNRLKRLRNCVMMIPTNQNLLRNALFNNVKNRGIIYGQTLPLYG